jgi:hypothetical protein
MKNLMKTALFLSAIMVVFFVSNFVSNNIAQASVPQVTECKLNNINQNFTFNPNDSTLSVDILSDQSVKFNTISICNNDDSVCSRTTAVKYFTYTSSYLQIVNKIWDGKTGGSSPVFVSTGVYKIRVTLANEGGESNSPGGYCSNNINVVFSQMGTGGDTSTTTATSTNNGGGTATTMATTTATTTSISSTVYVYSTHYVQEDVSTYVEPTSFEVSAGRDRLGYVGLPLSFDAKYKKSADLKNKTPKVTWSFGDGSSSTDEKVIHLYKYPGEYNVVLNASVGSYKSISRTKIKILVPNLSLAVLSDGAVEISNSNKDEINLYGWKLQSGNQTYTFPLDTIISGNKNIIFPTEYLEISTGGSRVILTDTADEVLAQANINPSIFSDKDQTITLAEVERFILELKKLAVVPAVSPTKPASIIINEENIENSNKTNIPLTASVLGALVVDADSEVTDLSVPTTQSEGGFWSKLFHPIRTIQSAFYK